MTFEKERRLLVLLSTLENNGSGTKSEVLNYIEQNDLMNYRSRDLQVHESRDEIKWRNDLAYVRYHLVNAGYMLNPNDNQWVISNEGKEYFYELIDEAKNENSYQFLNQNFWQLINNRYSENSALQNRIQEDIEAYKAEENYKEGKQKQRLTNYYERNPKLRFLAIEIHGTTCKVCGFNFLESYGKHGKDYIEVHHKVPLSQVEDEKEIDPETDLTVLCANCHRMVHRNRDNPLSIKELKKILK